MSYSIFERMKSKISLKIIGKNYERFLRRLHNHQIEILKITHLDYKTVIITIYEKDYETVLELKSIYEIDLVDTSGMIKIKRQVKKNKIFLLALLTGLAILFFLSRMIFQVEIVHTNKKIRKILLDELESYGISRYHMKKSFKELEKIKEEIITKYRNELEWIEFESVGTKYIVRVELRELEEIKEEKQIRNVVASKSAILRRVEASKGEILKNTNDYVKAGDTVISGDLKLNEEVKNQISAEGKIYGEVWYKITVTYPFVYREVAETGNHQNAYVIQFLKKKIQVFPWNNYKTKRVQSNPLLYHSFLPISFSKEKQFETNEIDEVNTEDEAIFKAEMLARKKMEEKLSEKEKIISQKNLKVEIKDSTIELEVFMTVLEDITSYQNIEMEKEKIEE